ncbi:MAG: GNAT family N-acetyltransferase [Gammaproteobacteria bacterium]
MNIREANIGDAEDICRLLSLLFEQEAEFMPDWEKQLKGIGEILANPEKGMFFVMEDAGRIIGTVSLLFTVSTALGGEVALLEDLVLAKTARGQGWGAELLDYAVNYAMNNGCLRITVLTDNDNAVGQSLYRKRGFKDSKMLPMRLVL